MAGAESAAETEVGGASKADFLQGMFSAEYWVSRGQELQRQRQRVGLSVEAVFFFSESKCVAKE